MAGRKKVVWSDEQFKHFERLCGMMTTKEDICLIMNVSEKTLSKIVKEHYKMSYLEAVEKFRATGRVSILRNQMVLSQKNAQVAIWLGKVYCGQRDPDKVIQDKTTEIEDMSDIRKAVYGNDTGNKNT